MDNFPNNKLSKFKRWLIKPAVRGCLTGGITILIGILCGFFGVVSGHVRTGFFIAVAILFIAFFVLTIIYGTLDKSYESIMKQNKTFEQIMLDLNAIFQQSAKNANKLIHEIVSSGQVNLNTWNFDIASELVCGKIFSLLGGLDENRQNFGVGYVRLDENHKSGKDTHVYMTAYVDRTRTVPTILHKKRAISDPHSYYDVQLFSQNLNEPKYLMSPEEVGDHFVYNSPEKREAGKKKYAQYIGIPVICVTEPQNKIVGLLEIICLEEKAFPSKDIAKIVVENYLAPFAQLLLLLHKLEKALLAVPDNETGGKET